MSAPAIIEAAARAWKDAALSAKHTPLSAEEVLQIVLAAVTPLLRAAALEEAVQVVEDDSSEAYLQLAAKANDETRRLCRFLRIIDVVEQKYVYRAILGSVTSAIRALKEQT